MQQTGGVLTTFPFLHILLLPSAKTKYRKIETGHTGLSNNKLKLKCSPGLFIYVDNGFVPGVWRA